MKYILDLRYVRLASYKCGRWLQEGLKEDHKYRYMSCYSFEGIYETVNMLLLLTIVSYILGTFSTTMLVTLIFMSLRQFAGGLHFKNYTKCAYTSFTSLLLTGYVASILPINNIIVTVIFSTIFALYLIYAPVENINKPLKSEEKKKYKIITISVFCTLLILFLFTNNIVVKQSILLGMALSAIITTPIVNKIKG